MTARLLVLFLLFGSPALAQDAFDVGSAQIVNAPDVRAWPARAAITQLSFDGATTRVAFSKQDGPDRWPDVTPTGWAGPLQYTLWLFVQVNGQWVGSGFIQMWFGRDGSGTSADPDVPSVYDKHWYYAERWSPIFGHGPIQHDERIGFMVTSGNARDRVGPFSVQERSNVVVIPATDRGTFNFSAPPVPTPVPTPQPVPVPMPPAPLPSVDLSGLYAQLATVNAKLDALEAQVIAGRTENQAFFETVKAHWKAIIGKAAVYAGPIIAALFAGRATK